MDLFGSKLILSVCFNRMNKHFELMISRTFFFGSVNETTSLIKTLLEHFEKSFIFNSLCWSLYFTYGNSLNNLCIDKRSNVEKRHSISEMETMNSVSFGTHTHIFDMQICSGNFFSNICHNIEIFYEIGCIVFKQSYITIEWEIEKLTAVSSSKWLIFLLRFEKDVQSTVLHSKKKKNIGHLLHSTCS